MSPVAGFQIPKYKKKQVNRFFYLPLHVLFSFSPEGSYSHLLTTQQSLAHEQKDYFLAVAVASLKFKYPSKTRK